MASSVFIDAFGGWTFDGSTVTLPYALRVTALGVGTAPGSVGTGTFTGAVTLPNSAAALQVGARGTFGYQADGQATLSNNAITGFSSISYGPDGGSACRRDLQKKTTGIADNSATAIYTVTVPNGNHAARLTLEILVTTGSTDAFESSRIATVDFVIARVTDADTAVAQASAYGLQIATVSGGATIVLAGVAPSSLTGASNATQTFTINVTLDDSGNVGSNQCVSVARLLNAEASGITIA